MLSTEDKHVYFTDRPDVDPCSEIIGEEAKYSGNGQGAEMPTGNGSGQELGNSLGNGLGVGNGNARGNGYGDGYGYGDGNGHSGYGHESRIPRLRSL